MGILKSNQEARLKNISDVADHRKAVTLTWVYKVLKAEQQLGQPYNSLSSDLGMSIEDQQAKNSQMSLGLQLGSVPCC